MGAHDPGERARIARRAEISRRRFLKTLGAGALVYAAQDALAAGAASPATLKVWAASGQRWICRSRSKRIQ